MRTETTCVHLPLKVYCRPHTTHVPPTHTHTYIHTQSPTVCELVRQHVASGAMFDPDSGKCHEVSNVCYLCTTHTSSRHQLSPQFVKHFAVLHWDGYK